MTHATCQILREPDEATSNEPVADNSTNEADNSTNEANGNVARSNENLVDEEGGTEPSQTKLVRQPTNSKESEGELKVTWMSGDCHVRVP